VRNEFDTQPIAPIAGDMMKILKTAFLALLVVAAAGCRDDRQRGNERWTATENTNVKIDWDKVSEAYKTAEGPADFEQKVNEIYEGDEIVSVSVHDVDASTQVVTGFFDKDQNGQVEEEEKIFTIQRNVTDEGSGQYQVTGHGPYYGYHSPMMSFAMGMMMGSMISGALRPGYVGYSRPYVTGTERRGALSSQRSQYRARNPERFSRSGKTYNSKGTRSWGSGRRSPGPRRSFGGGRFGIRDQRRDSRPQRLTS
jgi:hypothetical protein